jgi:hypothetical protein
MLGLTGAAAEFTAKVPLGQNCAVCAPLQALIANPHDVPGQLGRHDQGDALALVEGVRAEQRIAESR